MKTPVPKFGMLTSPVQDVIKEIKKANGLGFDFIEIGIEPPLGEPELLMSRKNAILDTLKKNKLFALGHTSWWCDLSSPIEELRRVWIEEVKNYIDVARALKINLLNVHAHKSGMVLEIRESKKQALDNFADSLEELVEYARPFGINLMLENMPSKDMRVKDFRFIMGRVPGLGMHLDVAHAFVAGGMKEVMSFIKTFRGRIPHMHMSDNHGKEDEHIAIGKGDIDYEKVVKELKKSGYDRTITFEVFFGGKKALKDSRKKIERLWKGKE